MIALPYLVFLGDADREVGVKTAQGVLCWRPEQVAGYLRLVLAVALPYLATAAFIGMVQAAVRRYHQRRLRELESQLSRLSRRSSSLKDSLTDLRQTLRDSQLQRDDYR